MTSPQEVRNRRHTCRGAAGLAALVTMLALVSACGSGQTVSSQGSGGTTPETTPAGPPSYLPPSQFKNTSEVPKPSGPAANTTQAAVTAPDATNEHALSVAFASYEDLPATCPAQTVPGTVYIAKVASTGVSWAIAGFKAAPGCKVLHDNKMVAVPPGQVGAFEVVPPPPVGVFEQQPGGSWVMNSEAGKPFPCPPHPAGRQPGEGNPFLPQSVLQALRIPYFAPNCVTVIPDAPR